MNSQRKVGSDRNGNANYGRKAVDIFFIKKIKHMSYEQTLYSLQPLDKGWSSSSLKKSKTNKILAIILEELFWAANKVGCSFFLWTLGLAFGGFKLWSSKSRCRGSPCQRFGLWAWQLKASRYAQPMIGENR